MKKEYQKPAVMRISFRQNEPLAVIKDGSAGVDVPPNVQQYFGKTVFNENNTIDHIDG